MTIPVMHLLILTFKFDWSFYDCFIAFDHTVCDLSCFATECMVVAGCLFDQFRKLIEVPLEEGRLLGWNHGNIEHDVQLLE